MGIEREREGGCWSRDAIWDVGVPLANPTDVEEDEEDQLQFLSSREK